MVTSHRFEVAISCPRVSKGSNRIPMAPSLRITDHYNCLILSCTKQEVGWVYTIYRSRDDRRIMLLKQVSMFLNVVRMPHYC